MSSKLQDYVFKKFVLSNVYTLEQLRSNCLRFGTLCKRHRNYFYRKYLQLSGYDVSDKSLDFLKIFVELGELSKSLDNDKDRTYLVKVDPKNLNRMVMSEDLLEVCKNYASSELVDFLKKSGFEISKTPVHQIFLTPVDEDINEMDTQPSPDKFEHF